MRFVLHGSVTVEHPFCRIGEPSRTFLLSGVFLIATRGSPEHLVNLLVDVAVDGWHVPPLVVLPLFWLSKQTVLEMVVQLFNQGQVGVVHVEVSVVAQVVSGLLDVRLEFSLDHVVQNIQRHHFAVAY